MIYGDDKQVQSFRYENFGAVLAAGWQIHDAEIEQLKAEIVQLKSRQQ